MIPTEMVLSVVPSRDGTNWEVTCTCGWFRYIPVVDDDTATALAEAHAEDCPLHASGLRRRLHNLSLDHPDIPADVAPLLLELLNLNPLRPASIMVRWLNARDDSASLYDADQYDDTTYGGPMPLAR